MSMFDSSPSTPLVVRAELPLLDEAQLAAAAFLARYSGRTLDSYRTDLRQFFQWASDLGLRPLDATRAHIELYRAQMEQTGLARQRSIGGSPRCAATTDLPTSTGASPRTRRSTCGARRSIRPMPAAWTAPNSACSCSLPSSTTASTPRSPCCSG